MLQQNIDSEDQWQAWRIGRDCKIDAYSLDKANDRLKKSFPQVELYSYFIAGFNGKECPPLTAEPPK